MIVCAQAFLWFDPDKTRTEFRRILKDENTHVTLIWNNRLTEIDEFAKAYDKLLAEQSTDYNEVNNQHLKGLNFDSFFKDGKYTLTEFPNEQVFDYNGLARLDKFYLKILQDKICKGDQLKVFRICYKTKNPINVS